MIAAKGLFLFFLMSVAIYRYLLHYLLLAQRLLYTCIVKEFYRLSNDSRTSYAITYILLTCVMKPHM